MEAKHTPGPWYQHKNQNEWSILGEDRMGRDGITSASVAVIVRSCPEAMANARLIAAAPELLEALEEIVAEWDAGNIGRLTAIPGTPGWEESVGVKWARDAIAKAKGATS